MNFWTTLTTVIAREGLFLGINFWIILKSTKTCPFLDHFDNGYRPWRSLFGDQFLDHLEVDKNWSIFGPLWQRLSPVKVSFWGSIFGSFWSRLKNVPFLDHFDNGYRPWRSLFGVPKKLIRVQKWIHFWTFFLAIIARETRFFVTWFLSIIWKMLTSLLLTDTHDFWGPTISLNRALGIFLYTISPCGTINCVIWFDGYAV